VNIQSTSALLPTPSLKKRLVCFVYEALLLFGLVFFVGIVFDIATQSRHALSNRPHREMLLFISIGCYLMYFWLNGGQTLAMKTWKIRLVNLQGQSISKFQALIRYFLIWMWFIPALIIIELFELKHWNMIIALSLGMLVWTLSIYTNKDNQYLHDIITKTRLVNDETPPKSTKTSSPHQ
jgi:uncharacterized RDD family membrane protein YckC